MCVLISERLQYKEDWGHTQEAFAAWWRHELDYPLLQATAPKGTAQPYQAFDWWWFLKCGDRPEQVLEWFERYCEDTFFGGAAFPNLFLNLGPGVLAAFFSGYLRYDEAGATSWFEAPQPWPVVESYRLQEQPWWAYTEAITRMAAGASKGRFIVGTTDIGGILDVLASFRGTEHLLLDLLTEPERVNTMRAKILEAWHQVYDALDAIIAPVQHGTSAWMGLWCPGRWYPLQCDFCAMISPDMFEAFVASDVQEQCRRLDHAIYHLDGPGQLPHLEYLLAIEELDGIQWVPGSGNPQCESPRWFGLYEKILASNKLLVLQCFDDVAKVSQVLDAIPGKGVLASVGFNTEGEAKAFLKRNGRL